MNVSRYINVLIRYYWYSSIYNPLLLNNVNYFKYLHSIVILLITFSNAAKEYLFEIFIVYCNVRNFKSTIYNIKISTFLLEIFHQ